MVIETARNRQRQATDPITGHAGTSSPEDAARQCTHTANMERMMDMVKLTKKAFTTGRLHFMGDDSGISDGHWALRRSQISNPVAFVSLAVAAETMGLPIGQCSESTLTFDRAAGEGGEAHEWHATPFLMETRTGAAARVFLGPDGAMAAYDRRALALVGLDGSRAVVWARDAMSPARDQKTVEESVFVVMPVSVRGIGYVLTASE